MKEQEILEKKKDDLENKLKDVLKEFYDETGLTPIIKLTPDFMPFGTNGEHIFDYYCKMTIKL
jgi:hypothetical protein